MIKKVLLLFAKLVSKGFRTPRTVSEIRLTRGVDDTDSFKIKLPTKPHRITKHYVSFRDVEVEPRRAAFIDLRFRRTDWDEARLEGSFDGLEAFAKIGGINREGILVCNC